MRETRFLALAATLVLALTTASPAAAGPGGGASENPTRAAGSCLLPRDPADPGQHRHPIRALLQPRNPAGHPRDVPRFCRAGDVDSARSGGPSHHAGGRQAEGPDLFPRSNSDDNRSGARQHYRGGGRSRRRPRAEGVNHRGQHALSERDDHLHRSTPVVEGASAAEERPGASGVGVWPLV